MGLTATLMPAAAAMTTTTTTIASPTQTVIATAIAAQQAKAKDGHVDPSRRRQHVASNRSQRRKATTANCRQRGAPWQLLVRRGPRRKDSRICSDLALPGCDVRLSRELGFLPDAILLSARQCNLIPPVSFYFHSSEFEQFMHTRLPRWCSCLFLSLPQRRLSFVD